MKAVRAVVSGRVQGVFFRDSTVRFARELGVTGWVRNREDGQVEVHAEGEDDHVAAVLAFLREGPPRAEVGGVEAEDLEPEGHEQFAVRGVSAGGFRVLGDEAEGFVLSLEVGEETRHWNLPKEPSMNPADKRFAIELEAGREGSVWDQGSYEQGGRVAWPEALDRGHGVFVLHGEKLRGGFALQRIREGRSPQWLLIKRRDAEAEG